MSVFNIIDQRTDEKEVRCDVILEIDHEDWKSLGMRKRIGNMTEWIENTSIYGAVMIACGFRGKVTIYLYDPGVVVETHKELIAIHPGLKNNQITQSKIPPEIYTPF